MAKPEKHVFVCVQSRPAGHPRGSCGEKNCAAVMETMLWEIQQRQLFQRFAVTNAGCLGPCGMGPNILVYPEGVWYGGVTPQDIPEIIEQHLLGGQPVERLLLPPEVWG